MIHSTRQTADISLPVIKSKSQSCGKRNDHIFVFTGNIQKGTHYVLYTTKRGIQKNKVTCNVGQLFFLFIELNNCIYSKQFKQQHVTTVQRSLVSKIVERYHHDTISVLQFSPLQVNFRLLDNIHWHTLAHIRWRLLLAVNGCIRYVCIEL